jgi:hypothetical protein
MPEARFPRKVGAEIRVAELALQITLLTLDDATLDYQQRNRA